MLRLARHPGVVDLVALRTEEDGADVLVTRLAGAVTLATWTPPSLDELAGVLVAVAETLADLHHLGLCHGALVDEHVVIDPTGRPVLCGFDGGVDHRPAGDVEALGRLTRHLVGTGGAPGSDDEVRSWLGPRRSTAARRRLLTLADQLIDGETATRPGARRFAAAVVAAVPTAVIAPPGIGPGDGPPGDPTGALGPDAGRDVAVPDSDRDPDRDLDRSAGPERDPAARRLRRRNPAEALLDPDADRDPGPERDPDRRDPSEPSGDVGTGAAPDDIGRARPGNEVTNRTPEGGVATLVRSRRGADRDRPRRGAITAVAIVGLALVVVGVLSAWNGERPELTTSIAAPAPTMFPAPGALAGASPEPTLVEAPAGTGTDHVPAASCAAPERCSDVRPGGVIDRDGTRFALGNPADELVVADPRCPTPPAIALLRRADGATYLFDGWATAGHDVAPRAGPAVVPGSSWVPQALDAQGCSTLVVRGPTGAVERFDPGQEPPGTPDEDPAVPTRGPSTTPPADPTGAPP